MKPLLTIQLPIDFGIIKYLADALGRYCADEGIEGRIFCHGENDGQKEILVISVKNEQP